MAFLGCRNYIHNNGDEGCGKTCRVQVTVFRHVS